MTRLLFAGKHTCPDNCADRLLRARQRITPRVLLRLDCQIQPPTAGFGNPAGAWKVRTYFLTSPQEMNP